MLFLKNKNILITGASRGFGARLAKKLWDEGANLFLTATQSWDVDFVQKYDSQKYVIFPFDLSRENVGGLFFKFLLELIQLTVVISFHAYTQHER